MTLEFMEVPMSQTTSESQRQATIVAENERLAREAEINQKGVEISQRSGVPPQQTNNNTELDKVEMPSLSPVPDLDYGALSSVIQRERDAVPYGTDGWNSRDAALNSISEIVGLPKQDKVPEISGIRTRPDIVVDSRDQVDQLNRASTQRSSDIQSIRDRMSGMEVGSYGWNTLNGLLNTKITEDESLSAEESGRIAESDQFYSEVEAGKKMDKLRRVEDQITAIDEAISNAPNDEQRAVLEEKRASLEASRSEFATDEDRLRIDKETVSQAEVAATTGNVLIDAANDPENTDVPTEAGPEVEEVAQRDPTGFSKAMNWISDILGVESKDFLRAGIYYAGSRLAGSSHGGAMNFAFSAAMAGVESRESTMNSLIQSGKYTPESLEKFRNSKDVSDLKQVATASPVNLDMTETFYYTDPETGAQSTVYRGDSDAGTAYYDTNTGTPVSASNVSDMSREDAAVEAVNATMKFAPSVIENVVDQFEDIDDGKRAGLLTGVGEAVEKIYDGFNFNGGAFDNATVTTILETATKAAIQNGDDNILRYIDEAMIQYKGFDWSDALVDSKGNRMPPEEFSLISDRIMGAAAATEGFNVDSHDRSIILQNTMDTLWGDWNSLTSEQRLAYENSVGGDKGETPFGNWLKTQI